MNGWELTFSAVLMAGGNSIRMGEDKATLRDESGLTLWQRQTTLLKELYPEQIMVSAPRSPEWMPEELIVAEDLAGGFGPMAGLASALALCQSDFLICLGIDLVNLPASFLKKRMKECRMGCGVAPRFAKGWEPLAGVYPGNALKSVREAMAAGNYKLQDWLDVLACQGEIMAYEIPAAEQDYFKNLNTREEFEKWKKES